MKKARILLGFNELKPVYSHFTFRVSWKKPAVGLPKAMDVSCDTNTHYCPATLSLKPGHSSGA